MLLGIKTGMADEARIARMVAPNALVMSGRMTVADFYKQASACTAIISYGLCGGLAPGLQIGQCIIADKLVTPNGIYMPDPEWRKRLFAKTKAYEHVWWASDEFNTADDPASRAALYKAHDAWVIDDESLDVAEYAKQRNIPFAIMRTVSDGANDIIPAAARNALKADGTTDLWEVMASLEQDPAQLPGLEKMADYFRISLGTLYTAGLQVGPTFQAV